MATIALKAHLRCEGGIHSVTGSASLDARFPGQWFQTETGLHYNWHRSYDPTLGRYTQPDPFGFVDGPSVYGYAGGSPQRWVDKDGRNLGAGAAAGGAVGGPAGAVIGAGIGGAVGLYCLIHPEICRRIFEYCFKEGDGVERIPPPPPPPKDKCDIQFDADILYCNTVPRSKKIKAACRAQAAERYAACLAGKMLPPLPF